jgi:hypothetical protein
MTDTQSSNSLVLGVSYGSAGEVLSMTRNAVGDAIGGSGSFDYAGWLFNQSIWTLFQTLPSNHVSVQARSMMPLRLESDAAPGVNGHQQVPVRADPAASALTRLALLLCVLWGAARAHAQSTAAISVTQLAGKGTEVIDASPCFLSDDLVALLVRSGPFGHGTSRVFIVRRTGSELKLVASTTHDTEGDQIYAVRGGRVLVVGARRSDLYSQGLKERWAMPFRILSSSFPRSEMAAEFKEAGWTALRLAPTPQLVRAGAGQLLSISDEVAVSAVGASIQIETLDGRQVGSIPVGDGGRQRPMVRTAGPGALLLRYGLEERIVDYNGREIARLAPLQGWGFRYGWSDDGSRVLFDHFTRTLTFGMRVAELFTVWMGAPREPKGEVIAVQDARKGRICFRMASPQGFFGQSAGYHGDLSPSGKWVAVATLAELSVFAVPDSCTEK